MAETELIGKSVLIVEDDSKIRNLVKIYLEKEGYEVLEAKDGSMAKSIILEFDPCLIILDLMLPDMKGEEICYWIRQDMKSVIPIIMLTAKASESSKIEGFKLGADDYVVKPFSPAELMVRIEAVLRRTASRCGKLSFGGLTIKPIKGEVFINGIPLELTIFEFKLLHLLMHHPGQVLSRGQILDSIYENNEKEVTDRTIDVHIKNLREKMKQITLIEYIHTVRGMGYKFETKRS
ncbi:response regulator transcription factor [Bacillus sp. FJAT-49736]|uniref:response regulator transcription factor n=1 Tax=Bacillus sp. FJAT-49736 TaxID=2833582 RepID=UPI001BCA4AAC|nr:response regulator transcription factor [Bacillus sp. FJAT-49736]MBS4174485.1 response regulator transcription factor [Bacillus sp. FJAT-49736]